MAALRISRPDVVVPVRVDPDGRTGPTPGQARGPGWDRAGPSYYLPASVDRTRLDQRIVEALGCLPSGIAITGWAALAWQGGRWFNGLAADGCTPLPVPVAIGVGRSARPRPGVTLSEERFCEDEVIVVDGLPITIPERSVSYEARRATSLIDAVRVINMAAYDDLTDLDSLRRHARTIRGVPGNRRFAQAIERGNENSWSPQEPSMQIHWEDRLGVRLLANQPIFDLSGRHLFTPDLLDLENGQAGEYNGDVHASRTTRSKDLDRDALARLHGIETTVLMGGRGELARFWSRLDAAYARGARRSGPRTWTTEMPYWWRDTTSVANRRALSPDDRERWLGHRTRLTIRS